jgi:hypothetical protein
MDKGYQKPSRIGAMPNNESTADLWIYHHALRHGCGIAWGFGPHCVRTHLVSIAMLHPPDHADQNRQSRRVCAWWREDPDCSRGAFGRLVAGVSTLLLRGLSGSLELGRVGEAVVKGMNIKKRFLGKS